MSEQANMNGLVESGSAGAAARWQDLLSGRSAIYSLTIGGSVVLHALNIYISTTIMPSVIDDIGGLDYYAWSTTLFVVASIVSAGLMARVFQQSGPRNAYALAAVLFCIGTVICAMAGDMTVLLMGRFIQGFGGGLLYSLTYAVVRIVFPERLWARAIGFESVVWGASTLAGPAVGGMFAEVGMWRAAFWVMVPFGVLFGTIAYATLPARVDKEQAPVRVPLAQLILLTGAVIVLSISSVGTGMWWIGSGVGVAILLLSTVVMVEKKSGARLLPSDALRLSTSLAAIYATSALLMIGMQSEVFVPYFLQTLHGQSPVMAGYLAALMAMGWTVGAIITSGWTENAARMVLMYGSLASATGLLVLAVFLPTPSAFGWQHGVPITLGLFAVGLGIGAAWPHMVTRIYQTAAPDEQDLAAGAITTVQLTASAFGAALSGLIANIAGISSGNTAGVSSAAFWICMVLVLAPLAATLTAYRIKERSNTNHALVNIA